MSDYTDSIESVKAAFDDEDVELDESEIADRLETLVEDYSVPESEAERSVIRKVGEEHGLDPLDSGSGSPEGGSSKVNVEDITSSGKWVSVEVQFVDEWDANHESIGQTGLVGDETGTIKFTAWDDANQPEMTEGESYRLDNVVTDSYQGRMSVQLQESSEVIELDEDIEAGEETSEVEAVMVDVNSGSGLVKRCPDDDCTRVIDNGRCKEHGEVDGEFDLRLKAVLDDGHEPQSVIFNREATEELTGITLDEAKEIASKELRQEAVIEKMLPDIVNRYYRIEGPKYGEYLMAQDFEELGTPDKSAVDEMLEAL